MIQLSNHLKSDLAALQVSRSDQSEKNIRHLCSACSLSNMPQDGAQLIHSHIWVREERLQSLGEAEN